MSHLKRNLAVALLCSLVICVAAPAAQGLPLRKPPATRGIGGDWLDAALSWLSRMLPFAPSPAADPDRRKEDVIKPDTGDPTGKVPNNPFGPFNGSCIDPHGCTG